MENAVKKKSKWVQDGNEKHMLKLYKSHKPPTLNSY